MIRGIRHVISGATLVAGLLLQATPALSQVPPWAQDRRRMIQAPQHAVRPAPQQQMMRQPGGAPPNGAAPHEGAGPGGPPPGAAPEGEPQLPPGEAPVGNHQ